MSPITFSIICVYNDEALLNSCLLEGLKEQSCGFEIIRVDNTVGTFKSAAAALNYGAGKAHGEYFMFVHQDVSLTTADWLEKAELLLKNTPDTGVAGVAGMRKAKLPGLTGFGTIPADNRVWDIYYGPDKRSSSYNSIVTGVPAEVQTLDEQLLLVPAKVFGKLQFDTAACPGWHLYGTDYALSVKDLGLKAYVLPLKVWHRSNGDINLGYYAALINILEKHRRERTIYTTCGLWHTLRYINYLSLLLLALKAEAGRLLGRNKHGGAPYMASLKMFFGAANDR